MSWKPLKLSPAAAAQVPPLLASASFSEDGYTIYLTDLTHIWSETLYKCEVIQRSREESTSIDPSEDDQLQIFLNKLKLGVEGGKDTTLALTVEHGDERPGFVLNVSVKLPGGLAPLEWPIRLSAAPQALMTSQFIIPLLKAQHTQIQEFNGMREVIREKDHVIQKVVDKLEALHTEFGEIFPQVAGKAGRKVDRKTAEQKVKGMGPFKLESWREIVVQHEATQDTSELIGEVFADPSNVEASKQGDEELVEDWWDSIKGITINLATGKFSTNGLSKKPKVTRIVQRSPSPAPIRTKKEPTDDDDFEVLPNHKRRSPISTVEDGDDTADETPPPKPSPQKSASTSPIPSRPKNTLGKIGGKKAPPEPEPESEVSPASEPEIKEATPSPPPKPKRGGIGKIGGKKKKEPTPTPSPTPDPDPSTASTATADSPLTPARKTIGAIGGKKHARPPSTAPSLADNVKEEGSEQGKKETTVEKTEEEVEETELERANRKREELKRELEEKAKAPVKKKRKF